MTLCPSCGAFFVKTTKQQAFCKTKGGTVCKDKYWNTITSDKRNNTTRISPANAKYMDKIGMEEDYDPGDSEYWDSKD